MECSQLPVEDWSGHRRDFDHSVQRIVGELDSRRGGALRAPAASPNGPGAAGAAHVQLDHLGARLGRWRKTSAARGVAVLRGDRVSASGGTSTQPERNRASSSRGPWRAAPGSWTARASAEKCRRTHQDASVAGAAGDGSPGAGCSPVLGCLPVSCPESDCWPPAAHGGPAGLGRGGRAADDRCGATSDAAHHDRGRRDQPAGDPAPAAGRERDDLGSGFGAPLRARPASTSSIRAATSSGHRLGVPRLGEEAAYLRRRRVVGRGLSGSSVTVHLLRGRGWWVGGDGDGTGGSAVGFRVTVAHAGRRVVGSASRSRSSAARRSRPREHRDFTVPSAHSSITATSATG